MFLDSVSHMDAGSRRRCCGCWCGRDHRLGWDLSRPGVVWVCFWVPGPPPHRFSVARFDAHAWWPVLGGWSDRVARGGLRTG